jgi:hypothetical protein
MSNAGSSPSTGPDPSVDGRLAGVSRVSISVDAVMSRVAILWLRNADQDWDPVGVWYATKCSLQSRVLPGRDMEGFFRRIHDTARPPCLDDGETPGTWEDFIGYALDTLSNGHDLMVSEVEPEGTLDATYAKWVLGLTGDAPSRWQPTIPSTITLVPMDDRVVSETQRPWT